MATYQDKENKMIENIFSSKRNIDIVFCIDGTGSMTPCLESVKRNAINFQEQFAKAMTTMGSDIDSMRVKVIVFRDYHDDGDQAMQESSFFELPADKAEFQAYIDGITANGGGDNPENGLEALYYAMKSKFTTGSKDRQVIVLFTDADALPLGARAKEKNYPKDMANYTQFLNTWGCVSQSSDIKLREKNKRLIMFAPAGTIYEELKSKLNRSLFEPVQMSDGLGDILFDEIIKIIAASASSN